MSIVPPNAARAIEGARRVLLARERRPVPSTRGDASICATSATSWSDLKVTVVDVVASRPGNPGSRASGSPRRSSRRGWGSDKSNRPSLPLLTKPLVVVWRVRDRHRLRRDVGASSACPRSSRGRAVAERVERLRRRVEIDDRRARRSRRERDAVPDDEVRSDDVRALPSLARRGNDIEAVRGGARVPAGIAIVVCVVPLASTYATVSPPIAAPPGAASSTNTLDSSPPGKCSSTSLRSPVAHDGFATPRVSAERNVTHQFAPSVASLAAGIELHRLAGERGEGVHATAFVGSVTNDALASIATSVAQAKLASFTFGPDSLSANVVPGSPHTKAAPLGICAGSAGFAAPRTYSPGVRMSVSLSPVGIGQRVDRHRRRAVGERRVRGIAGRASIDLEELPDVRRRRRERLHLGDRRRGDRRRDAPPSTRRTRSLCCTTPVFAHAPVWQVATSHASPSSHVVPSDFEGFEQSPVDVSHAPAVWH